MTKEDAKFYFNTSHMQYSYQLLYILYKKKLKLTNFVKIRASE
jgi:hypothetical protein